MRAGKRFTFFENQEGYIKSHYLPSGELYVDELFVHKQFRGLGHGRKMVNMLPIGTTLLASPIPDDDGTVSEVDLVKFYESCGFLLKPDKFGNKYMRKEI